MAIPSFCTTISPTAGSDGVRKPGNELDIFISDTSTPTGQWLDWTQYRVDATNFPDYPKLTLWPDAYLLGTNEWDNPVYALDRNAMLGGGGGLITAVRRTTTGPAQLAVNHTMPVHFDGPTLPPAGEPGILSAKSTMS